MHTVTLTLSREKILSTAAELPAAPQIMGRLYQLLVRPNSGMSAIAELIKRDPALTSRVIRISNSPTYGSVGIGSIEEALQRVGFGEVYRLVGSAANAGLVQRKLTCYGHDGDRFRRHNLLSALIAERLARHLRLDARMAYTAGLLRQIGQLILNRVGEQAGLTGETFVESGRGRLVEWERGIFGISHYEVGGLLIAEWGFPTDIIEAVAHDHSESGDQLSPLARVIDLTDNIVRLAGFGLSSDESEWGIPSEKLAALTLDAERVQLIQEGALADLNTLDAA